MRAVAAYVKGKDVVDIRPTTDVAACLLRTARSVTSVVVSTNATMCASFEATVHRTRHGHAPVNYSVLCSASDYKRGVPDGDVFIFWQRLPGWSVGGTRSILRAFAAEGRIRPTAVVLTLFDLTSWRDAGDWQGSEAAASWWHQAAFDERAECLRISTDLIPARHQAQCRAVGGAKGTATAGRACGRWAAGAFPLSPTLNASERPHDGTAGCPFTRGKSLCVEGTIEGSDCPPCLVGNDGLGGGLSPLTHPEANKCR